MNYYTQFKRSDGSLNGKNATASFVKDVTRPTAITMGIGYVLLLILFLSTIWMVSPG